jgi:predicted nucleotidyltransferase
MQYLAVLEKITKKLEADDNVLAVLVFGSVADNTYHENSDIDLSIIYKEFSSGFEFSTDVVDGIKVGYSNGLLSVYQKEPLFLHIECMFLLMLQQFLIRKILRASKKSY